MRPAITILMACLLVVLLAMALASCTSAEPEVTRAGIETVRDTIRQAQRQAQRQINCTLSRRC